MLATLRRATFRAYGTLLPGHAARWFEGMLLTPRPVPALNLPTPAAPHVVQRVPYGTGWLTMTEWGTGPAVLLVHGWGGSAASFNAFIEPLAAAGYRAVTVDLPAHGRSDGRRTNLVDCAGAVLQVGRAAGSLAGIVTHSFGGPVTALAWRHGLRAERVVMLAPPQSIRGVSLPVGDWLGLPRSVSERMLDEFALRLGVTWEELRTDRLAAALGAPLRVVHDEDDRIIPWSHGAAVARAAPRGSLRTTSGLGHRDVLVDPAVIADAVAFLTADAARVQRSA
jgi:pimeloyl-ACP methyl ester carboxylesterase